MPSGFGSFAFLALLGLHVASVFAASIKTASYSSAPFFQLTISSLPGLSGSYSLSGPAE